MTIDEEIKALVEERKALFAKKEPIDARLVEAYERIEQELQTCCLLCKNCHAAVHANKLCIVLSSLKHGIMPHLT